MRNTLKVLCGVAAACIVAVTLFSAGASAAHQDADGAASIELAQALTAALNAHDVDAIVELFSEENAGPTVYADRYAWQKYEIRRWAERQAAANIHVEAYDFRLTDHGAAWNAEVSRDDFRDFGMELVSVTNSIWVYQGKVAAFTSLVDDPVDAARLGSLWEPGTVAGLPVM